MSSRIANLLQQATNLLHKDVESEVESMNSSPYLSTPYPEKYEQAKVLFEEVLKLDPNNWEAREGLLICDEMLSPYYPVQYMAPLEDLSPVDLSPLAPTPSLPGNSSLSPSPSLHPKLKPTMPLPWEVRFHARGRDQTGLNYTAQEFSKARKKAENQIQVLLEEAKKEISIAGIDPAALKEKYLKKINELQDQLNQGWKGHGPEILSFGKKLLDEIFHD